MEVEAYATLRARLAEIGADRAALLSAHGLDEEAWEELDDAWQERLSCIIEADEGDTVPALLQRYSDAFVLAQRAGGGEVMSVERFAACTRAMRDASDPRHALARLGTNLGQYLRSSQHWAPRLATEPHLAELFERALRGGGGSDGRSEE